ncbi:MAG: hypothetical protein AAFX09_09905 [Pseudomonadota bacterium]
MPKANALMVALRERLADANDVSLGQLQLINLDLIKAGAGDQWSRLRARVFDVSEHFIAGRLSPGDALIRCEEGFLVIFAQDRIDLADERTKEISQDLNSFYLGDEFFNRLSVRSSAITIDKHSFEDFLRRHNAQGESEAKPGSRDGKAVPSVPEPSPIPVFEPAWDVQREVITGSLCLPQRRYAGQTIFGHVAVDTDDGAAVAQIDLAVAVKAIEKVRKSWKRGVRAAFSFTPHYRTLEIPAARVEYLSALRRLPASIRRHHSICVRGLPDGVPLGKLQEVFRSTHGLKMSLMVELGGPDADLSRFRGCGVSLFVIPAFSEQSSSPNLMNSEPVSYLVERAKAEGASAAVTGLTDTDMLAVCLNAGVAFVSGPIVGSRSNDVIPPKRLKIETVLARADAK